jgi:hypothetical protein
MMDWTDLGIPAGAATVIGGLLVAFGRWLKPLVESAFAVIPEIKLLSQEQTVSMRAISMSMAGQAEAFKILARVMSQSHIASGRTRHVLLLVEDSPVDAKIVEGICTELIRKYRLHFVLVTTIDEAISQVVTACVVILDVILPDNNEMSNLQPFVAVAPCPVIIHSRLDYTAKDFPNAYAVIKKGDSDLLRETIESAILGRPYSPSGM